MRPKKKWPRYKYLSFFTKKKTPPLSTSDRITRLTEQLHTMEASLLQATDRALDNSADLAELQRSAAELKNNAKKFYKTSKKMTCWQSVCNIISEFFTQIISTLSTLLCCFNAQPSSQTHRPYHR